VGLVDVLLGLLDWRAGGRNGFCSQMKWNESEASIGRVLAIEVGISVFIHLLEFEFSLFYIFSSLSTFPTSLFLRHIFFLFKPKL
jgi:hypothetical protein